MLSVLELRFPACLEVLKQEIRVAMELASQLRDYSLYLLLEISTIKNVFRISY